MANIWDCTGGLRTLIHMLNYPFCKFELWFCNLEVISQLGDDLQLDSQLGGHFAAKEHFHRPFHSPFHSCEMRGWICEMALVCQGVVSQLRNTLRNFRRAFRSTLCSCLQTAITSSFQLRFIHRLKRWTPNFLRFETKYSMHEMDSIKYSKCVQ